jgi:hypothetical protein
VYRGNLRDQLPVATRPLIVGETRMWYIWVRSEETWRRRGVYSPDLFQDVVPHLVLFTRCGTCEPRPRSTLLSTPGDIESYKILRNRFLFVLTRPSQYNCLVLHICEYPYVKFSRFVSRYSCLVLHVLKIRRYYRILSLTTFWITPSGSGGP